MSDNGRITWRDEKRRLSDLKPWPRNPRQIREAQAKRLASSFDQFGQVETLAIGPDGEIYNGHQRLNVLMAEHGADYQVDVRVASRPLTEKEREKLTVYLHRGAAGEWDFDTLANEFDFDELLDWGFDEKELLGLDFGAEEPAEDPGAQVDRAAELLEKWKVKPGDLFTLGEHRLICGDCTDASVVERVMQGEKADLVFTDAPYNVGIVGGTHDPRSPSFQSGRTIDNDSMGDDEFDSFLVAFMSELPLRDGAAFYLCAPPGRPETQFRNALCVSGLELRECIVWVKDTAVFGRQDYHWRHESILYGWKDGAAHYFTDNRTDKNTVWEIQRPKNSDEHPTMKPVELPERAIENSSKIGWIVFDGFVGSGTTLIACERLNRKCRAIEISPAYCAVAIERWSQTTGGQPVLVEE